MTRDDWDCKVQGHSYAVNHYLTGGRPDEITCSCCGDDLVWSNEAGWWITKEKPNEQG